MRARPTASLVAVALATSPAFSQDLRIVECSLGCSSGGGGQIGCTTINVFEDEQLDVVFDRPVDPTSLGPATLQVIDVANGSVPPGQYLAHADDPRRISFRPAIAVNGLGGVTFGFEAGRAYQIRIPGTAQGDGGPFLLGVDGTPNTHRLLCTVVASLGVGPGFARECVATINSSGAAARIDLVGSTSQTLNDLTLEVTDVPPSGFGLFAVGTEPALLRMGAGAQCVSGTVFRLPVLTSDALGSASFALDMQNGPLGGAITVGSTWYAQYVFRDSVQMGATTVGASDAVRFTVRP